MKKRITLSKLQVKSFVTQLNTDRRSTLKGGTFEGGTVNSIGDTCAVQPTHTTCPVHTADSCDTNICPGPSIDLRCDPNHTKDERCAGGDTQQNTILNCTNFCG